MIIDIMTSFDLRRYFIRELWLLCTGLSQLDAKESGKMGFWAILYYMATTFIAVIIGITVYLSSVMKKLSQILHIEGIIMVVSIRPGASTEVHPSSGIAKGEAREVSTLDAVLDLIR